VDGGAHLFPPFNGRPHRLRVGDYGYVISSSSRSPVRAVVKRLAAFGSARIVHTTARL
jgi:hypothetical protein